MESLQAQLEELIVRKRDEALRCDDGTVSTACGRRARDLRDDADELASLLARQEQLLKEEKDQDSQTRVAPSVPCVEGQDLPQSGNEAQSSWAVTVERDGETIVTLSSNGMGGRDLRDGDNRTIKAAAEHLLSFIGSFPVCVPGCHDESCEAELTSHGYTPCRCDERSDPFARIALYFHEDVEGEYGCPGISCPGVQRLIAAFGKLKGVGLREDLPGAIRPREDWQPIATCPQEVTRALIYWPAFKLNDELMQSDEPTGDGLVAEGFRIGRNDWESDLVTEHFEDEAGFGYGDPTHWQPLPSKPVPAEKEKSK